LSLMSNTQNTKKSDQSYWAVVGRQFAKNKLAVWSLRVVYALVFVGVFADFIANEKPIYCKLDGKTYFPIFREYAVDLGLARMPTELVNVDWLNANYEAVLRAPVPYSPLTQDFDNAYANPTKKQDVKSWRFRHLLGSDQLGCDLLSGMVHGTRIAMLVGVVSMGIASFIGILLGAMAGYFGDERLLISRGRLWLNLIFIFFAWFYAFNTRSYIMSDALADSFGGFLFQVSISLGIFAAIMAIPNLLAIPLKRVPVLGKRFALPVDIIISRSIEVLNSVPLLLLILSICAVVKKPSIMLIMVIIGMTSWTGIAGFIRAELLKVRSLEYIEAAQSLGFSQWRIMFRHAIPNALTSVLITIAFGVASAILTESALSFLGIGVQADVVTWGKLLKEADADVSGWWFAVFPGLAIFVTVTVFNLLGEGLTDAMDPRLKQ
jgi:peptide/nickel transport system permease protein